TRPLDSLARQIIDSADTSFYCKSLPRPAPRYRGANVMTALAPLNSPESDLIMQRFSRCNRGRRATTSSRRVCRSARVRASATMIRRLHMASDLELQPASEDVRFVPVYTTGRILRFNMALDTLRQAKIPVQAHEETGTGLKLVMPVLPTLGPGVFWTLSVPEESLDEAQQVLSELPFPISTNPGPWDFLSESETAEARADAAAAKWILAIGFLAIPLFFIAFGTIALIRRADRDDAISMIGIGLLFAVIILGIVWQSRRWSARHK